jgi:sugar transferase EpsL
VFGSIYRRYGKRLLDLVLVIPALIVLSPVMVLVAIIVRVKLGRGVLYCQQRPGLDGKPFTLYKFRTMIDIQDEHGNPLSDADRLTRCGRVLRRFSLDELPQLWNVLRGELSLVGPRPLVMRYLPRYSAEQMRRHEVRPGLTGWAQVNGRNTIPWEDKFAFDVWYVDHLSFSLDIRIILRTLWLVLRRANVSATGHATMPEFMGSSVAGALSENQTQSAVSPIRSP